MTVYREDPSGPGVREFERSPGRPGLHTVQRIWRGLGTGNHLTRVVVELCRSTAYRVEVWRRHCTLEAVWACYLDAGGAGDPGTAVTDPCFFRTALDRFEIGWRWGRSEGRPSLSKAGGDRPRAAEAFPAPADWGRGTAICTDVS